MNKTSIGAGLVVPLLAAPLMIGAASFPALAAEAGRTGYLLTSEALVMIPSFNQEWLDLTDELYLQPNGFPADGTVTFVQVPETSNLNESIVGERQNLLDAIMERWDADDHSGISADDPLYVFGYSQSAVAAGMLEQQLADNGIPLDAIHFVFVGDTASPYGMLSNVMDTLLQWVPESWRDQAEGWIMEFAKMNNIDSVIGLTAPTDLYQTDIYTLTGDGFANWDNGMQTAGMFWDHLAYLGLTADEIGTATDETIGQLTIHTIDSGDVDMLQALSNSLDMIMSGLLGGF